VFLAYILKHCDWNDLIYFGHFKNVSVYDQKTTEKNSIAAMADTHLGLHHVDASRPQIANGVVDVDKLFVARHVQHHVDHDVAASAARPGAAVDNCRPLIWKREPFAFKMDIRESAGN